MSIKPYHENKSFSIEDLPEDFQRKYIGGRGFNMKRLCDEVPV